MGYSKIAQHIKCDRYATRPGLEDSRTETCRFKAVYALQDLKQPCSNRGRQIFTKRHWEKTTSISSDQSRQRLHSLFAFPQSDMLGNFARNLQNQCCEGRALQAQLIPKIYSTSLHFSLFSSFYISLFLLICLIFFILLFFPFSHSTGDNPLS